MSRIEILTIVLAMSLALVGASALAGKQGALGGKDQPGHPRLSASLQQTLKKGRPDKVDVIVTFERGARASAEQAVQGHGQVKRRFENFPVVQLSVPEHVLEKVA